MEWARCAKRWGQFVGVFLLALAWSPSVRAAQVVHGDFRFDVEPEGGTVCVAFPKALQDPKTCAGLDVESVNARLSTLSGDLSPVSAMIVRVEKRVYVVLVMHNGKTHEEFSKEAARALARAGRDTRRVTFGEAAFPDEVEPAEMRINGVQVIRYELLPRIPADDPRATMSYQLQFFAATDTGNYSIGFFASPEDINTANVLAQRSLATLHATPGGTSSRVAGVDAAWYAAEAFAGMVAVGIVLFLVVRSRNKRLKAVPKGA